MSVSRNKPSSPDQFSTGIVNISTVNLNDSWPLLRRGLKFGHLNVNRLYSKLDSIKEILNLSKLDQCSRIICDLVNLGYFGWRATY